MTPVLGMDKDPLVIKVAGKSPIHGYIVNGIFQLVGKSPKNVGFSIATFDYFDWLPKGKHA